VRKWCAYVPKTVERTCKTNFAAVGPAHQVGYEGTERERERKREQKHSKN